MSRELSLFIGTPYSDSICATKLLRMRNSDGTATVLVGIEPERPGYELLTFQCPKCEHFETDMPISVQNVRF
jgi:hypothetical protein